MPAELATTTDSRDPRSAVPDLVIASLLALYLELLFIRWLPATIHVLGYFTNVVLLATFLGMGVGVARRTEGAGLPWCVLAAVAALVAGTVTLQVFPVDVTAPNVESFINEVPEHVVRHVRVPLYPVLAAVFGGTALAFVPVGQLVGRSLAPLPTLRGYAWNVGGSLLGILAFAAVSALGLPPAVWVGLSVLPLAWFLRPRAGVLAAGAAMALAAVGGERAEAARTGARISWSPYYKIHVKDIPPPVGGSIVQVNNNFLLLAVDLAPRPALPPFLSGQRDYYALPYAFVRPARVLVLGAGAGNDCQMALLQGAKSVTAVEIDPAMARLGREGHPARPLSDPRVRLVVDDARSFLQRDRSSYDAIVFGTLDSHSLFASMGSVRMESFVYTRECFRAAADRLAPGGVLVVCVGPMADWVHARIVRTVEAALGEAAHVYYYESFLKRGDTSNLGIVAGPGARPRSDVAAWRHLDAGARASRYAQAGDPGLLATDDWPNVFLQSRSLPAEYMVVLGIVLLIGTALVAGGLGTAGVTGELFLLGAGFMLLETRSITEMGLVFGVTWRVSSIVIAVILLVILGATVLSERASVGRRRVYPLLLAALLVSRAVPTASFLDAAPAARLGLAVLYVGAPVFLAALAFADAYRRASNVRAALGGNLLGAALGGVLEYASTVIGLRNVTFVAMAIYATAMALSWRRRA